MGKNRKFSLKKKNYIPYNFQLHTAAQEIIRAHVVCHIYTILALYFQIE